MAKSREEQKSRNQRRSEARKKKKVEPLLRRIGQLDVSMQIMQQRLGQLSAIMRNFTIVVMLLKDKGIITDAELKAKDEELTALRNTEPNEDSENPTGSDVQPEGTGDTSGNLADGGPIIPGEGLSDINRGSKSLESGGEEGTSAGEIVTDN